MAVGTHVFMKRKHTSQFHCKKLARPQPVFSVKPSRNGTKNIELMSMLAKPAFTGPV